jgi:microcystin degradation protein MlrC
MPDVSSIAIGRVWQETNTFSEVPTTIADFHRHRYLAGAAMFEGIQSEDDELAGFADVLESGSVNIVPLLAANCWCGGPAQQAFIDDLIATLADRLHQASELDGVVFSLHGALVADVTADVDGQIAATIRDAIGPDVPLVLTLDHHANVTRALVDSCDGLTAYRHCPHIDMRETGRRGAAMLLQMVRSEVDPVVAYQKLPLVTPCECFMTDTGPMSTWFRLAQEMERQTEIIDVSLFPVQPWIDVPELGWSVAVTTNNQPQLAEAMCGELAQHAWDHRDEFYIDKYEPADAVRHAAAALRGPVIIADGADATNGGSPGDSTCLLKEMMAQEIACPAYLTIVDKEAVLHALEAGEGSEIELKLGARHSRRYHNPVRVRARVERFSDGRFDVSGHIAQQANMGRCVLLRVGSIHIVVSEQPGPGHDPEVFRQIGLEPRNAQIVVLKCTVGHMNVFADIMTESLACECPGPSPSYLHRLDYRSIPRPIYPLDRETVWKAA